MYQEGVTRTKMHLGFAYLKHGIHVSNVGLDFEM